jgi:hypothetical protein
LAEAQQLAVRLLTLRRPQTDRCFVVLAALSDSVRILRLAHQGK